MVQNLSINSSNESTAAKIKLPTSQVSKFNGDIKTWQSFWGQFNSAIHSNDEITDINNSIIYIRIFVSISGLSPTSTNYNTAVELLRHPSFDQFFMNKFVMLEKIKNDKNIKALRKLLDQTESSIRNLQSLHVETSSYGTILVLLINDKLPDNLRISVAKNFENEVWDIEGLIYFLRKKVEAKECSFAVRELIRSRERN